jgi:hypothetical protein
MHRFFGWRVAKMDIAPEEKDNNTYLGHKSEHNDWEAADSTWGGDKPHGKLGVLLKAPSNSRQQLQGGGKLGRFKLALLAPVYK